jgi:hypothetical protein
MLTGSFPEVDEFVKTSPWGIEHTITFHEYWLDDEPGWSVLFMADPTAGDEVEGLVYAYGPGKKRGALVALAPKRRIYETNDLLREDAAHRDLRDLARLLERFPEGAL